MNIYIHTELVSKLISGGDAIPAEPFQILNAVVEVLHSI